MINRAMSVACWLGWAALVLGAARVGWYAVMAM